MSNAPFPIDPVLTGIAIAYRNPELIADFVLPRFQPVLTKKEFKYYVFSKAEQFTVPNTAVGRRGVPSEVEFSATELTGATLDYGLDDPIPQDDIDQQPDGWDIEGDATASLTDLIALDRERRASALVFTAGTYPSGSKTQLTDGGQFNDAASSPIDVIQTGLDTPLLRPNTMVIGQAAWTKLSMHPKVLKAVHGNDGDSGIARREQIKELFELKDIFVGRGFVNTAKKGQTASYARVWGKHCALLHLDPMARGDARRATFGGTFQYNERIAGSIPDSKIGLRGGQRVRVGESVVEKVLASDLGYFIEDAVE